MMPTGIPPLQLCPEHDKELEGEHEKERHLQSHLDGNERRALSFAGLDMKTLYYLARDADSVKSGYDKWSQVELRYNQKSITCSEVVNGIACQCFCSYMYRPFNSFTTFVDALRSLLQRGTLIVLDALLMVGSEEIERQRQIQHARHKFPETLTTLYTTVTSICSKHT